MTTTGATTPTTGAPARRPGFHRLRVERVERLTADAVALSFAVPEALREQYDFVPGQHLTLRRDFDGEEARRSYSICAPAGRGVLRVAVKRLDGGLFSRWAVDEAAQGDELDVMVPAGRFGIPFVAGRRRHYGAVAAGSGITPVLSLVETALATEPDSRFTLVYGNRTTASVMFLDELADLKDRHPQRLQVVHVLSREPRSAPLLSGRLDAAKLAVLLEHVVDPAEVDELGGPAQEHVVDPAEVDEWFLCGPAELVEGARTALAGAGVPAARVHRELFHVAGAGPAPARARPSSAAAGGAEASSSVTAVLDGRRTVVRVPAEGGSVLDAVLGARPDAPYACRGGVCGTCRAKVVSGSVRMDHEYALETAEKEAGYVLTCQSHPTSPDVVVDFDA